MRKALQYIVIGASCPKRRIQRRVKLPLSAPDRHHLRQGGCDRPPKKKRTRDTMSNRDGL
jgi:hypothetical protein